LRKEKGKLKRETASLIVLTLLIGSMLFSASRFVKCQTDIHDLRVRLEAGPTSGGHHLTLGQSRVLNASVWNDGNVPEPSVTLLILINDSVAVSSTVANLASGTSFNCSYDWSRPDSNVYNITAYAPPVFSETSTANNAVSWLINVCNNAPPEVVLYVYFPPRAPGPVAGENVTFDASASFDPDWGNITSYTWSFNDTPGTGPVCTYIFPNFGNANVALTLKDTEDETSSPMSLQLRVYARPNATSFTVHDVNPTESGLYMDRQLIFDASNSYDPDNNTGPTHGIANYTWNFGDGPPLVTYQNTTSHTYSMDNTYPVNLTVTDYDNLTISYAKNIFIGSGIPKANFTVTTPGPYYVDDNLTFDASNSAGDGGEISSYNWNWNDTYTDNTLGPSFQHSFSAEGLYNVTLIVMDTDNKTSAPFGISVPVRLPVLLRVSNSTGGNILTADPPTGTFNVNISIVNVKDLSYFKLTLKYQNESIPLLKCVNYSLIQPFNPGSIIPDPNGGLIQVTGLTTPGRNGNLTLATIGFAVTNPGNCTLYLSLSDYTLLNSTNGHIYVDVAREHALNVAEFLTHKPFADFTYIPSAPSNITTTVFNASRSYDPDNAKAPNNGIANYYWDFGDNSTPTNTTNPITPHPYQNPGNYTVTLNVTDYTLETWWANYTLEVLYGRDVGVVDVTPYFRALNTNTSLYEAAGNLPISVTVVNDGTAGAVENFNVTIWFGAFRVETEVVRNLAQGDNRTILFNCSIGNVPNGVYSIIARAEALPDEINPSNNDYTDGSVRVYLQGDVNRDNWTNILDSILLSNAWNSKPGEGNWNPNADLNCDGQVNILDAIILANGFLLKLP
jgi:PKD repeat protein